MTVYPTTARFLATSAFAVAHKRYETLLAECCHTKAYGKGNFVYVAYEKNLGVWKLEQGFVQLGIYTEAGDEMTTAVLKAGDLFGNFSEQDGNESEFARALTDVQVKFMDQTTFRRLSQSHPELSYYFTQLICERFLQLKQFFLTTTSFQVKERIVALFWFLAKYVGTQTENRIVFTNFLTHQDIAQITYTTRQTVTKLLSELQDEGALMYSRKQIILLPPFPTSFISHTNSYNHVNHWHASA